MMMKKLIKLICLAGILSGVFTGCGGRTDAPAAETAETLSGSAKNDAGETKRVADSADMAAPVELDLEGLTPVTADMLHEGVYAVDVDCSSSMFKITDCELTVADGRMTAVMTMSGRSYLYVYPGTGAEAAAADETDYISYAKNADGAHTFTLPVPALDAAVDCAAFSKNKEMWYDRTLVFRADSLPAEAWMEKPCTELSDLGLAPGSYTAEVALSGGSGKASVQSPCRLTVDQDGCTATLVWGSSSYDYMVVDGAEYLPVNTEGNSVFEIPVSYFDYPVPVRADTTAMSHPYLIDYTLVFDAASIQEYSTAGTMDLKFAEQFSVDCYTDGTSLITIGGTDHYLLLPEGMEETANTEKSEAWTALENTGEDAVILQMPLNSVYLAASSAMDFYRELGVLDTVRMTSTKASDWSLPEVVSALEHGEMLYAGKYSAPDYELVLSEGTDLAIESTMIYHSPETMETLKELGIPVLVERSSYEPNPLGRLEWIRLYGLLSGHSAEAESYFEEQASRLAELSTADTGKTVAFFYIGANGHAVVRRPGDYISKMIALAGGHYILPADDETEGSALSTMNMEMESFYEAAQDADVIIYNSAIDGEITSVDELLSKSGLLASFKAVQNGEVWCTGRNMFQQTTGIGDMIVDIHRVLTGSREELTFLHHVE